MQYGTQRRQRRTETLAVAAILGFLMLVSIIAFIRAPASSSADRAARYVDEAHSVKVDYIHMEPRSFHMFAKHLLGKTRYVEWGAGGSTQLAPYMISGTAYSIEHVPEWCAHLKEENTLVRTAVDLGKLLLVCVEHNLPLIEWGYPHPNASLVEIQALRQRYVTAVDRFARVAPIDFVLIDGRFRVLCALHLLRERLVDSTSRVMIHDFHHRANYESVLKFYDIVEAGNEQFSSVVLAPRTVIDENELMKEYQLHEFDYK